MEKFIFDQLNEYVQAFLNKLTHGCHNAYSTQHAVFKLFQNWQKELDSSGNVATILMDLSKFYVCLPHDLVTAKLRGMLS